MTTIFDILANATKHRMPAQQQLQSGVIIGFEQGKANINVGGITYNAEIGLSTSIRSGDRVWVVIGHGTVKIIGLVGRDD